MTLPDNGAATATETSSTGPTPVAQAGVIMANNFNPDPTLTPKYVTVYESMIGWRPVSVWWNDEDELWEPWEVSPVASGDLAYIESVAQEWALEQGLPFYPQAGF